MGEFFYFLIYVAQQLGVMLGVGAQTVLLCAHLIAVHHGDKENPHVAYAEAARKALGAGFVLVVVSGLFAVATHLFSGQADIVLSPAFLFKWALIVVLLAAFFCRADCASGSTFITRLRAPRGTRSFWCTRSGPLPRGAACGYCTYCGEFFLR